MVKIAVLMTCFNRVETTLKCLELLFAQKLPDSAVLDVWLVDDASPDKTGEIVKAAYPRINVIMSPGNLYWAKGMRLAWDTASSAEDYDYYLWLNDDTMLFENAIVGLVADDETIDDEAIRVIVGTTCTSPESPGNLSYGCRTSSGVVAPIGVPQKVTSDAMSGNCVLIPRRTFTSIGPICGDYHHAFADRDYSLMLKAKGGYKYVSSRVIGSCPQQPERYLHLTGLPLKKRLELLFHPKGYSLHDTYILRMRHFGILRAIASCLHVIGIVIFPRKGM